MKTKSEIVSYLDSLKAYSVSQKEEFKDQYIALMEPLYSAVNQYFSNPRTEFKKPLNDLSLYMHNELWARGAKWEIPFDQGFSTDYPKGYYDLCDLFYAFDWTVTPEAFFNAWVMESPSTGEGESGGGTVAPPKPVSNPYIDSWVSEVNAAPAGELEAISGISSWIEKSLSDSSAVMLWEDQGSLESHLDVKKIAQELFINRKLFTAANTLNLPVYIPSYIDGQWESWEQPKLTSNFEVGGNVYGCAASVGEQLAFLAFDGKEGDGHQTDDGWAVTSNLSSAWLEFYSPELLKIESVIVHNRAHPTTRAVKDYELQVSLDGVKYDVIASGTNPNSNPKGTFTIQGQNAKGKHIRLVCKSSHTTGYAVGEMEIKAKAMK